jgi:hypothetical protein
MFRSLSKLFSSTAGNSRRKPAPALRRSRLGIEVLEDRAVPSATAISHLVGPIHTSALVRQGTVSHTAAVNQVPNLAGVTFTLSLSFLGQPYQVFVTSETYQADGSASVSCTLKVPYGNAGQTGPQTYQSTYGTLSYDPTGRLTLYASWQTTADSSIWFWGAITTVQNSPVRGSVTPTGWHYAVTGLISFFQNNLQEPINVTGQGNPPPLLLLP